LSRQLGFGDLCNSKNHSPRPTAKSTRRERHYRGLSAVVKFDISPPLREMRVILPGTGQKNETTKSAKLSR
jgi:hypothetical protein